MLHRQIPRRMALPEPSLLQIGQRARAVRGVEIAFAVGGAVGQVAAAQREGPLAARAIFDEGGDIGREAAVEIHLGAAEAV